MNTLKLLRLTQFKKSQRTRKSAGFTLIELLVALIMAALIITPVLGFMINLLQTDRQEQAKATSEQELQAAADYIARDLQQAVYIYDQQALNNDLAQNAPYDDSGIKDQLPEPGDPDRIPVLVFWKRERVPDAVPINAGIDCETEENKCDDTFVYSLVAYYLIKDAASNNNSTWSDAARIGRWEISDGVRRPSYINPPSGSNDPYLQNSRKERDEGFALFNLGLAGSLREKMNRWENSGETDMKKSVDVLVDYIDHTTIEDIDNDPDTTDLPPNETCTGFNPPPSEFTPTEADPGWTQVPDYNQVDPKFQTNSFYACVRSAQNIARVYLRGNALARIRSAEDAKYSEDGSSYFPTARIEVKGIGGLSSGD